jgi:DNA-binding PadR family transcriptional regulator
VSTRLLILGIVRIFQPVHGYDVRRKLLSWRMESWVSSKPGSVYSALRTLEKDGLITEAVGDEASGRPRAGGSRKTEYVVTPAGEKEFATMLRKAWWTIEPATEPLIPALNFMGFMSRQELIAALRARAGQIEGRIEQLGFFGGCIDPEASGADGEIPGHVWEIVGLATSKHQAELQWTRSLVERLEAGLYWLADDRDSPAPPRTPTERTTDTTGAEPTTDHDRPGDPGEQMTTTTD